MLVGARRYPVNPEVLVWALLFVVGCGLAYRFAAWTLKRDRYSDRIEDVIPVNPPEAEATPTADSHTATISAPPVAIHVPERSASPPPRPITATPPPSPQSVETATPPITRVATVAPIIAASVRATLAPAKAEAPTPVEPTQRAIAPDVRATLAPRDIAAAVEMPMKSTLLANVLSSIPDAIIAPGTQHITIRRRGTRLRARRIGLEVPPLDQRIKETRAPRIRSASKKRSKRATLSDRVNPLLVCEGLRIRPLRRIRLNPDQDNPLASTNAKTKIVGMPRPNPRVRVASAG